MSDEIKRQRYEELKERERGEVLTEAEGRELAQLTRELCDNEDAALASATSQLQQENVALRAELERLESRKTELEELLIRKERFLLQARALARGIEAERRGLLEDYRRITGERLLELEPTRVLS
jgi:hypothetical protein